MSAVIELAKQLINCPSITPADAGCQSILEERLQKLGFQVENLRFGEVDNLWARFGKTSPLIIFAGHTDVVPTGPLSDWDTPPFEAQIKDGHLYGRGASDMKAAIAAMVIATEHFVKENPSFPASIAFLITSDEEGPSINGTQKVIEVLEKRGEKIDYCIIGEPSSAKIVGDQIRIGRRGSLHGKLTIEGKQGHVAHPHLANNPIHLCFAALDELVKTTWDKGNTDFPPTTFQITNFHSGTGAANVIPGHAEILFNFRFSTAVTPSELQGRVEDCLNRYRFAYHIDWHIGAHPFLTKRGALINATQEAIKTTTSLETIISTGGGTSDGRFIAKTGAEIVELGLSHETAHQVNENIRVEDLEKLVNIYKQLLSILIKK